MLFRSLNSSNMSSNLIKFVSASAPRIYRRAAYFRVRSAVRSLKIPNLRSIFLTLTAILIVNSNSNSRRLLAKTSTNSKNLPAQMGPAKTLTRSLFLIPRRQEKERKSGVYSLGIRVASISALLDVSRDIFAKRLHSLLDRPTVGRDPLGIECLI